ncbi:hypothetical protein [Streptomyces sp. 6N223]|uniref:hypothetical protein n=1 Tax=Streptomyces sp. 6N223 TaxID=3457412 RepID=UPI003FD1C195
MARRRPLPDGERPAEVHTEPPPGGRDRGLRPHHPTAPAVRYADGTALYALHSRPQGATRADVRLPVRRRGVTMAKG